LAGFLLQRHAAEDLRDLVHACLARLPRSYRGWIREAGARCAALAAGRCAAHAASRTARAADLTVGLASSTGVGSASASDARSSPARHVSAAVSARDGEGNDEGGADDAKADLGSA
jgi:hypothetical protein